MSIENFIPEIWSGRLFVALKKALVLGNVVNRDYEGEIAAHGDTVRINSIGPIAVRDYTKDTDISIDQLDDAATFLKIDQQKYFAFSVDDIDKAQQKPKVMDQAMVEGAYALAKKVDDLIAGFYTDAGSEVSETSLAKTNAIEVLADTSTALDENDVPREGRFCVLPPFAINTLVLAEALETSGSIGADGTYRSGFVGSAMGFNIWMSNNLTEDSDNTYGMAGTRRAISFADQILHLEAFRPEKQFGDAVKGLHVYGAKVIDPKALVSLELKLA